MINLRSAIAAALVLPVALTLSACASAQPAKPTHTATPTKSATPTPTPTPTPTYNLDDPGSFTVVVNKHRPLNPLDFEPGDLVVPGVIGNPNGRQLRAEAAGALERLATDANAAGIYLTILSGYRSYATQEQTYNNFVARDGEEIANQYSAQPGHSEHQTGLAVDLDDASGCALYTCFADTAAGQWLAANAWQYGFVLRYPDGYIDTTGYEFEPWHYRYVGIEVAAGMHNGGTPTLEQFFGLEAAPTYY